MPSGGALEDPLEEIKRRVKDRSERILLVGESETLSTTLALAAMRGSFDNMWASNYLKDPFKFESGTRGVPHLVRLMRENIKQCAGEPPLTQYGTLTIKPI